MPTVKHLKVLLDARGLSTTGRKFELEKRLKDADAGPSTSVLIKNSLTPNRPIGARKLCAKKHDKKVQWSNGVSSHEPNFEYDEVQSQATPPATKPKSAAPIEARRKPHREAPSPPPPKSENIVADQDAWPTPPQKSRDVLTPPPRTEALDLDRLERMVSSSKTKKTAEKPPRWQPNRPSIFTKPKSKPTASAASGLLSPQVKTKKTAGKPPRWQLNRPSIFTKPKPKPTPSAASGSVSPQVTQEPFGWLPSDEFDFFSPIKSGTSESRSDAPNQPMEKPHNSESQSDAPNQPIETPHNIIVLAKLQELQDNMKRKSRRRIQTICDQAKEQVRHSIAAATTAGSPQKTKADASAVLVTLKQVEDVLRGAASTMKSAARASTVVLKTVTAVDGVTAGCRKRLAVSHGPQAGMSEVFKRMKEKIHAYTIAADEDTVIAADGSEDGREVEEEDQPEGHPEDGSSALTSCSPQMGCDQDCEEGETLPRLKPDFEPSGLPYAFENENVCAVCRDAGELILCDHCPRSFHIECCAPDTWPDISQGSQDTWQCPMCAAAAPPAPDSETLVPWIGQKRSCLSTKRLLPVRRGHPVEDMMTQPPSPSHVPQRKPHPLADSLGTVESPSPSLVESTTESPSKRAADKSQFRDGEKHEVQHRKRLKRIDNIRSANHLAAFIGWHVGAWPSDQPVVLY